MVHPSNDVTFPNLSNTNELEGDEISRNGSIQAAIARTTSRSMALYFARPVRLFRPAKVNGWQTLRNLAKQQGATLTYQYLLSLVKLQGLGIIPRHFVPPMIINACLGTVLWGSYGEASTRLEPLLQWHSVSNAAVSGAIAGVCQAAVAAPAENVRMLLEHGFRGHSWSCAWKEVFLAKGIPSAITRPTHQLKDIRQLRNWMHEVGQMAGRGWNGWGWGCGKDTVGFAAFFLIFELSRRTGTVAKGLCLDLLSRFPSTVDENSPIRSQLPAIVNGVTLVSGGVIAGLAYEYSCRPWDIARRVIYLDGLERREPSHRILKRRLMEDGFKFFFQSNILPHSHSGEVRSKWTTVLRTAGRVGPWGVGFLVWEAFGSGGLG